MLDVKNLSFSYGKNNVLNDVSFSVPEGRLCGLFGPNGCGKTTIFKCCLRFLKPARGSVRLGGADAGKLRLKEMAKLAAYVPQEHTSSFPYLVKEIVLMGRTPHLNGVFRIRNEDKRKAMDALDLLGIMNISDQPYNLLSGGQRQMVLIARALAQDAPLIFLDEPTAALDFSNQIKIWRILQGIVGRGATVIACTHDPNHVSWFCNQIIIMSKKGILANGSPAEVMVEPVLHEIYEDVCTVGEIGSTKMILPREVTEADDRRPDSKVSAAKEADERNRMIS